ncbi:MAG: GNAT family acetyltransferase [Vicinamibacteria bacterium]
MTIRPFVEADEAAVVDLWRRCGLLRPWNDPKRDIARKLTTQRELFLVGEEDGRIVAAAMAGYDGHRGWVNYLAVDPERRGQGLGRRMMETIERELAARGCPKLNLQVRRTNPDVIAFYEALGYVVDDVVSLGKRLVRDE